MPIHIYNELSLDYRIDGEGDKALLFIHGLGGDKGAWKYQGEHFRGRYRIVTLDLYGHGQSSKEVDPVFAPRQDAEAADSLMREIVKCPYVAIGHSFASNILPEIMKLGDPQLKGVVFVDCTYQGFEEIVAGRMAFAGGMLALDDRQLKAESVKYFNDLLGENCRPEDREMVLSSLQYCSHRWLFQSVAGCREYNRKHPPREAPIRDDLPVFIMESEFGVGVNINKSWVNHFKQASYYLFENADHFFFITEKDKFNRLLGEFVEENI
jgi:pimeloyl-ACP methyl ester carboxylesterase